MLQVFSDYLNTQTPHFTLVEEKEGEESHTRVTAGPHPAEGKQGEPKVMVVTSQPAFTAAAPPACSH